MELLTQGVQACIQALRSRSISAFELVTASLASVDELDGAVRAFTFRDDVAALAAARIIDQRRARGENVGSLSGLPIAVKDLYDCAGLPTSYGAPAYRPVMAKCSSTAVSRLVAAGAVVVGKTRTAEFAWSTTTAGTRNPKDHSLIPGGSSGGSAAAVSAGMVPAALGTDTGGSIRIPAALCGIAGIKPTYGAIGRGGILPCNWSLDTAGPLGGRIEDLRLLLAELVGHDTSDPASAPDTTLMPLVERLSHQNVLDLSRVRLGVIDDPIFEIIDSETRDSHERAMAALEGAGAEVIHLRFPAGAYVEGALLGIDLPEGAAIHTSLLSQRRDKFDPSIRALLHVAHLIPGVLVTQAHRTRHMIANQVRDLFRLHRLDAIVAPAAPGPAIRADALDIIHTRSDGTPESTLWSYGRVCWLANLTGQPAVVVPLPDTRPPLGIQLIGRPFLDDALLDLAAAAEEVLGKPRGRSSRETPRRGGD